MDKRYLNVCGKMGYMYNVITTQELRLKRLIVCITSANIGIFLFLALNSGFLFDT